MLETYEEIEAFNKASTEWVSKISKTMLTYRLHCGEAVELLASEEGFEIVQLSDIVDDQ
jgi:hypothetical protein